MGTFNVYETIKKEKEEEKKGNKYNGVLEQLRAENAYLKSLELTDRVKSLISNSGGLLKEYNSRFFDKDGNYINQYRKDTASALDKYTTLKNNYDAESTSIIESLNKYKKYLNPDYVKEIEDVLSNNSKGLSDILSAYTSDHDYFSKFKNEEEYKSHIQSQKEYEAWVSADTKTLKTEIDDLESNYNSYIGLKTKRDGLYGTIVSGYMRAGYSREKAEQAARSDSRIAKYDKELSQFGDMSNSDKTLSKKKEFYNNATRIQEGIALRDNAQNAEDFDKHSKLGANIENPTVDEAYGGFSIGPWKPFGKTIGNKVTYSRENYDEALKKATSGQPGQPDLSIYGVNELYTHMNDDEVAIYNYYLSKEGEEKADEFLDSITESLSYRQAEKTFEDIYRNNVALEALLGFSAGLDQWASGVKALFNTEGEYVPQSVTQMMSGMAREDLGDDYGIVGQGAYDLINTTANMLPSILVSTMTGNIAGSLGAGVKVASTIGKLAGAATLGSSAAGNGYQEMLNLGYDKEQARAYGTLVGISEAGLEYALGGISSLGGKFSGGITDAVVTKLISNVDNAIAKVAIGTGGKLVGSMISEFGEEYLQEVLDPVFKNITLKTDEDIKLFSAEALYSGILGALSAGLLEGGSTLSGEVATYKQGKSVKNSGQLSNLKKLGTSFSADTVAYKIASQVNENTDAYTIGQLLHEVGADGLSEANIADITTALEKKGINSEHAQTIAKWVDKVVQGEKLSKAQQMALDVDSDVGYIVHDILINKNSTVNQRIQGYNDILMNVAIEKEKIKTQKNIAKLEKKVEKQKLKAEKKENEENANAQSSGEALGFSEGKSTPETENALESKFEVNLDGETVNKKTGDSVKVAEIASIDNGKMTLKLDNGETVDADDISFGAEDDAMIYTAVLDMGVNAAVANSLVKNFNPSDKLSAKQYALGIKEAYKYGSYGMPINEISKKGFAADLSEAQRTHAYNLGKVDTAAKVAKAQEEVEKGNTGKVGIEGKVNFKGDTLALKEVQRESLKRMAVLSEVLGVDFDVFESYTQGNKRLFKDTDGKIKSAPNGFYKDGKIHIDLNAGKDGQGIMIYTVAHELTHWIREWSPAKFKVLADFLMEQYGAKGRSVNDRVQAQIAKAERNRRTIDYDTAYEEVVADSMEMMLSDDAVYEKILELKSKDESIVKKIGEFFAKIIDGFRKLLKQYPPETPEGKLVSKMKGAFTELQNLFAEALVDASNNYQANKGQKNTTSEGDVKLQIREDFYAQLDNWDGQTVGFSFVIGTTSDALKQAKIPDKQIRWDASKIKTLLSKHNGMTIETIRKIPELLENPVVVIDSKQDKNSKIVMGELHDNNGKLVTVVLLLTPTSKKGNQLDVIKVSSAQGRGHIESLFKNADGSKVPVRYVDKKRIQNWLNVNRLQLPLHSFNLDSTDSIPQTSKKSQEKLSGRDTLGNTLTEAQQEYFAESKVRDENGNLKVMYHGTPNATFTKFRSGTYFTEHKTYADNYQNQGASSLSYKKTADNPDTYAVYLDIKKPFDTRNKVERDIFYNEYYRQWGTGTDLMESGLPDWLDGQDLQEFLEENDYDYDGLILDEGATGGYGEEVISRGFSYVVFNPEQVKSVDNKNPTKDADYRFSDRDERYQKLQTEYNQLEKEAESLKKSEEYLSFLDAISLLQGEELDKAVKEYGEWTRKSGLYDKSKRMSEIIGEQKDIRAALDNEKELSRDAYMKSIENLTEKEKMDFVNKAVERYGTTKNIRLASYLMLNGEMLDFSEGQRERVQDHREISEILDMPDSAGYSDGLIAFMNMGNIRLQTYGIDISKAPNQVQKSALRDVISQIMRNENEITVDFSKENGYTDGSVDYPRGTSTSKILADIDSYFETGVVPEYKSTFGEFLYSDRDSAYIDAVNNGDMETAQRLVDEAAKEAGFNSPIIYHGTSRFGFTKYDLSLGLGMIYGSTKSNVAANYGGRDNYAFKRKIGRKYISPDSDTFKKNPIRAMIQNAETVLEQNYKVLDDATRQEIRSRVLEQAQEITSKLDELYVAFDNIPDDIANDLAWVTDLFYTVTGNDAEFFSDDADVKSVWTKELLSSVDHYKTHYENLRGYLGEHLNDFNTEEKKFARFLMGYDLSDAAIDIEYRYLRAANPTGEVQFINADTNQGIVTREELQNRIDLVKDVGVYSWYGDLGNNPLVVDAEGKDWLMIKVPEMNDDKWHNTDHIAEWARENGYTSVVVKNVYDGGELADDYIFFNSNQVKSADPVTYDDNGNVIPLSERFNAENEDIRYSDRDSEGNTLSKEQQDFFANSKVRDNKGRLIPVYHGTTANFNIFRKGDVGYHFGTKGAARGRVGYSKNVIIKECYLNITNPIVIDEDFGSWDADFELTKYLYYTDILSKEEAESILFTDNKLYKRTTENANKKLAEVLMSKGYDGIEYQNTFETKKPTKSYIAFSSNQAKLTSNTNPTSNPDIRYSDRDYVITDNRAAFTEKHINELYEDYSVSSTSDMMKDYAQEYVAYIKPSDFLSLTSLNGERIRNEAVELDLEKLQAKDNRQLPYLEVDEETGEVYEHDGRHRLIAFENAGIEQVAIRIVPISQENKYHRKTIDINLKGQEFTWRNEKGDIVSDKAKGKVTIKAYPLSPSNRPVIEQLFGTGKMLYSDRDSKTADDIEKINKQLARENVKLIEDVKYLKELVKLQGKETHGKMLKKSTVELVAKRLMAYSSAKGNVSELAGYLTDVYNYIIQGEDVSWEGIKERSQAAIDWLMQNENHKPVRDDYADSILKELRTKRVSLNEAQKKEAAYYFGSYNDFRKKNMGRIIITNDGIPLDSAWQELAEMYPSYFDKNVNASDQPIMLMEIIDGLQNSYIDDEYHYYSDEMIAQDLLTKIYEGYWDVSALHTVADAKQKEINLLKGKHKDRMDALRQSHEESDAKLRQEHREKISQLRTQYREREEAKIQKVAQYYQKSRKEAIDRVRETREKRDAVTKLQKLVLDTAKWVSYPAKDDVKCPDIIRKPYAEFLSSIDLTSKRALNGGEPTQNDLRVASAMDSLAKAIEKKLGTQSPDTETETVLDTGYLDLPVHFVDNLKELAEDLKKRMEIDGHIVNAMSSDEIKALTKFIRTLNHSIKEMSTLYSNMRFARVEQLGNDTMVFLKDFGEAKQTNSIVNFVTWDNALPYYTFKRFGVAGESVFEELMDAQDKLAYLSKEIFKFKEKTWTDKEASEWSKDTHTIKLPSGRELTLTSADAMSIYCLSRREQGRQHLLGGGVRVLGIEKNGKKANDSRSLLNLKDIEAIYSSLTDRQKKVAEAIQEYMSTVCSEWGNEISMKRFLTKEFTEKFYFPIESNDENLDTKDPKAQQSDLYRLLNISATKPLTKGANNEVIIRNVFDVFTGHTSDMARLNAYGMALLDYMKWINYREKTVNDDGQISVSGVRKSMERAYGPEAKKYVIGLIKDINGRANDGGDHPFLMKMTRAAKTAMVGANLRVSLLQFTAFPRAAMVLSNKSLALGLTKIPQIEKAKKYCGIALWKSFGFYDTNISRSIEDQIKGTTNVRQKLIELSLKGAEWGDAITWGCLWNACEYEVAKTKQYKVGSEEFNQAVGKKLREVVYATQVVDSTLTRSQMMRNKSGLTQSASAFMSEPTLSANILMDAGFQFNLEKRRTGSGKVAWQKTSKYIGKAVAVYSIGQIFAALAEAIADAYRDDDDEEYMTKFGKAFVENAISDLNPFNKIPIIADISDVIMSWFGIGFSSSNSLYLTAVDEAKNAFDIWSKVINGEDGKTVYAGIYSTTKLLSYITGVSASGAMREVVTLWNNTAGAVDPYLKIRTYETSATDKGIAEYKFDKGDTTSVKNTVSKMIEDKVKSGKTEKEAKSAIRSSFTGTYKAEYLAAVKAKDYNEMNRIRKFLYATGLYGTLSELDETLKKWRTNE